MRVPVGPVADVPDDECVAVGDGQAVVVRVGDELRAFENRCLHQESPLARRHRAQRCAQSARSTSGATTSTTVA